MAEGLTESVRRRDRTSSSISADLVDKQRGSTRNDVKVRSEQSTNLPKVYYTIIVSSPVLLVKVHHASAVREKPAGEGRDRPRRICAWKQSPEIVMLLYPPFLVFRPPNASLRKISHRKKAEMLQQRVMKDHR
jgi:hypothetical protein